MNRWMVNNYFNSLNNLLHFNFFNIIWIETFIYLLQTLTRKVLVQQILQFVFGRKSRLCLAFKTLNKWKQLFCYFILAVYPLKSQNMDESLSMNISMRHNYVFVQLMNSKLRKNYHHESNASICQYFHSRVWTKICC